MISFRVFLAGFVQSVFSNTLWITESSIPYSESNYMQGKNYIFKRGLNNSLFHLLTNRKKIWLWEGLNILFLQLKSEEVYNYTLDP